MSVSHLKGGTSFWTCVKDYIIDEKEDYKDIGIRGFDYKLFEEEQGGGTIEGLDGYPYLKHLIQLWPGDWENRTEKMNEAFGMNNYVTVDGGGKQMVCPFRIQDFWECIGCLLSTFIY